MRGRAQPKIASSSSARSNHVNLRRSAQQQTLSCPMCTTDGTPVSLLEAMAVGRPVVALRNASVEEWVSEPGGRLVGSLDPHELAAALAAALEPGVRVRERVLTTSRSSSRAPTERLRWRRMSPFTPSSRVRPGDDQAGDARFPPLHLSLESELGDYYQDFSGAIMLVEGGFHGTIDDEGVPLVRLNRNGLERNSTRSHSTRSPI